MYESNDYCVSNREYLGTRDEQQDSTRINNKDEMMLVCVCDGMGGLEDGKEASNLTVNILSEAFLKEDIVSIQDFLILNLKKADREIFNTRKENNLSGVSGTTAVAAIFKGNEMYWVSVGDSRIYFLHDDELLQLTKDHNYLMKLDEMLAENLIDKEQYEERMDKAEALISFIGSGKINLIDYNEDALILNKDDRVLLTTDGLYRALQYEEIKGIVKNFTDVDLATQFLINKAKVNSRGVAQDNTSIVLIKKK